MRRTNLPGMGFIWIVLVIGFAILFFIFAQSTPPLDEVWNLSKQLKIGMIDNLNDEQKDVFLETLEKHKGLQQEIASKKGVDILSCNYDGQLCGDEALIIRIPSKQSLKFINFDVYSSSQKFPFKVKVSGLNWSKSLKITKRKQYQLEMPSLKEIEFITLKVLSKKSSFNGEMPGVKVSFSK